MLKGLLSRLSVMATPVLFFLPLWKLRGRVSKYRGCAIAYSLREQLGGGFISGLASSCRTFLLFHMA